MFNKNLDIGVMLMLTLMGLPLMAIGILVAMLLPLVQWIRVSLE